MIGKITEAHAVYYREKWGFDVSLLAPVRRNPMEGFMTMQPCSAPEWLPTMGTQVPDCYLQ